MAISVANNPAVKTTGNNENSYVIGSWEVALSEAEAAKKAGVILEKPASDQRSAEQIINDNPVLKNLGDQEVFDSDGDGEKDMTFKEMLRERIGDYERDANAAYRAAQILEHIEKFDADGNRIAGGNAGNGRIDGLTRGNDARNGTEAGRLQDFGKFGFSNLKGELNHPTSAGDNQQAREEAEKLGIKWQRPEGDKRSAQDIIDANPLLKNLGNQSGVKDMLKERVGDYENDADAAYRAVQVLQHVEKLDSNGEKIAGKDVGNGSIDGFTNSGEARNGTEAGRLQDFGKYGFSSLKGKLVNPNVYDQQAQEEAEKLGFKWRRPEGDKRSAKDIIDSDPLLKNLGNQSGVRDMLKERVGDFENDADAAYRAVQVLHHVEKYDAAGNRIAGKDAGNGSIDGFTNSGEARNGTEAGRLQDFGKYGFSSLKGKFVNPNDQQAREEAEKLGFKWQRPEGDKRSAQEIIDANPLLKNLGNQSGVKDMLKERVGDYENDADAAYRAVQVLQHVVRFDADGNRIAGRDTGNGSIDGFTNSGEARNGTEAGRLQDFGKYGFSNLKGKFANANDQEAQEEAEKLGFKWRRPEGDSRSAKDIIDSDPLLKNLGNQSGIKDMLKERVGDYENDADAAYRAVQVLHHVEKYDAAGNRIAVKDVGNGSIDGFTNSGEARNGTEAGRLQDFGKYGFSSLKGKFVNPNDQQAREEAEKLGFKWQRPEGDKRSAQEIIDANPLLKNLGNQSGIKDMLKERVGDYENDADAAFRAAQIMDRVVMFDENGKSLTGNDVANSSIDGFTNSGEARHGTEAGRLQDFGKYGFSVFKELPSTDEITSYKDFVAKNPGAGDLSNKAVKNAAILEANFDIIRGKTGAGDSLTAADLKKYKEQNTYLSDEIKEALDFWSQPGMLAQIDAAGANPAFTKKDGKFNAENIKKWIADQAPKNDSEFATLLNGAATMSLVSGVDTSKIGSDIFVHPENYDGKTKAAVMMQLIEAGGTLEAGLQSELWTPYGRDGLNGNKDKVKADIASKITLLSNDKDVQKYLTDGRAKALQDIVDADPTLKSKIKTYYDTKFTNGGALTDALAMKDEKGKTVSIGQAVELFASEGQILHMALGRTGAPDYVGMVERSGKKAEIEKYYLDNIVTGKALSDAIDGGTDIETALSSFTHEVAALNVVLDEKLVTANLEKLQTNLSDIVSTKLFDGATKEDLLVAFGDGKGNLDEAKMLSTLEEVEKANPDMFKDASGKRIMPADVVAALRGAWVDDIRQGAKIADALGKLKFIDKPSNGVASAYGKGIFHLASALFMGGILTARGVNNGSTPAAKVGIATAAMQFSGLLLEGGSKWNKDIKDVSNRWGSWMKDGTLGKIENAGKILGGIGGILAGSFGIASGVNSLNKGDKVGGGLSLTGGILGLSAGIASTVEGIASLLGGSAGLVSGLGLAAGVLGVATAAFTAIALIITSIIEVSKHAAQQNDFYAKLSPILQQYGINGGPMTEDDWPITEGA